LGGGAQAVVMKVAVSFDDGGDFSGNSVSDGSGDGGQVVGMMDSDTGGDDGRFRWTLTTTARASHLDSDVVSTRNVAIVILSWVIEPKVDSAKRTLTQLVQKLHALALDLRGLDRAVFVSKARCVNHIKARVFTAIVSVVVVVAASARHPCSSDGALVVVVVFGIVVGLTALLEFCSLQLGIGLVCG
jgi:hypothetical protein